MSYPQPNPIPNPNNFNYNYFQNLTDDLNIQEADNRYLKSLNIINGEASANKALVLNENKEILGISKLQIGTNLSIVGGEFGILNTDANSRFRIGSQQTTGNCMTFQWTYIGNNNASNRLGIDFFGQSNQFCILNNGNIGIGTGAPVYRLQLSVDSAAKPSSTAWTVPSDERIKENIEMADLNICYNNIKNLKLKRYKYKDDYIENHSIEDKTKLGWISQDVKEIIPKAVTITKNEDYNIKDFHSLNIDQIIACMYGTIQKLQLIVEEQQKFLDTLEIE